MGKIFAFIIGFIVGKTAVKVMLDIITFDIPMTKKIKYYPGAGDTASIMGGSITSLVLWSIIVGAIFAVFCALSEAEWYYVYGIAATALFYRQNKSILLTLYRNKHIQSLSSAFAMTVLCDNPETGLVDYEDTIKLIEAFTFFHSNKR